MELLDLLSILESHFTAVELLDLLSILESHFTGGVVGFVVDFRKSFYWWSCWICCRF